MAQDWAYYSGDYTGGKWLTDEAMGYDSGYQKRYDAALQQYLSENPNVSRVMYTQPTETDRSKLTDLGKAVSGLIDAKARFGGMGEEGRIYVPTADYEMATSAGAGLFNQVSANDFLNTVEKKLQDIAGVQWEGGLRTNSDIEQLRKAHPGVLEGINTGNLERGAAKLKGQASLTGLFRPEQGYAATEVDRFRQRAASEIGDYMGRKVDGVWVEPVATGWGEQDKLNEFAKQSQWNAAHHKGMSGFGKALGALTKAGVGLAIGSVASAALGPVAGGAISGAVGAKSSGQSMLEGALLGGSLGAAKQYGGDIVGNAAGAADKVSNGIAGTGVSWRDALKVGGIAAGAAGLLTGSQDMPTIPTGTTSVLGQTTAGTTQALTEGPTTTAAQLLTRTRQLGGRASTVLTRGGVGGDDYGLATRKLMGV